MRTTEAPQPDPADGLERAGDAFLQAWEASDPDAIASFFAPDARATWKDGAIVTGREDVREALRSALRNGAGGLRARLQEVETSQDGSVGYTIADHTPSRAHAVDPPKLASTRAVALWHRREDGRWQVLAHTAEIDEHLS